uniref:Beta b protein n=1 Tax=Barley stripe mosaic virus TaxID=12327 RepID=A0A2K9YS64_BSMV|nr:beta b protein [Barley stripe mosaic virus]
MDLTKTVEEKKTNRTDSVKGVFENSTIPKVPTGQEMGGDDSSTSKLKETLKVADQTPLSVDNGAKSKLDSSDRQVPGPKLATTVEQKPELKPNVKKSKKKRIQKPAQPSRPNDLKGGTKGTSQVGENVSENYTGISKEAAKQKQKTPKSVKMQSNLADKFRANDTRRSELINKFQQFVHETCLKSDFEYTGRQYFRARSNFFEMIKLASLYDKHLKECMARACTLERERLKRKLLLVRALKPAVDFLTGIISGVPGSGKSTIVRTLLKGEFPAVCALANPALMNDYSGIEGVYGLDDLLLSAVPITSDLLIIDEYTLAESAEILLLQRRLRASMVLLVGDVAQGKATTASSIEYLTLPVIYRSETTYRLGQETASLCSKQGNRMVSKGGKDTVIITDYDGETDGTEKNIAFTVDTVRDVKDCGYDCALAIDVQGKEFDSVTLFLRNEDRKALADKHLRLVALSRHKSRLIIRADAEIRQAFLTGDIDLSSKASNSHRYSAKPDEDHSWFKAK